ncbi:UNVERIFIED_CONTAM: hypothetical protein K2H54_042698 [Gekko kuhli]
MEAVSAPEGITECVLPMFQLEHVSELAALSEATAKKEEDQTPELIRFYMSEATAEREEDQPPGLTCFNVSKAVAEKEEDQPSGPTLSYMSEATENEDHQSPGLTRSHVLEAMEEKEDQPSGSTRSCVSKATAKKEEDHTPGLTRSHISEAMAEREEDQPPGPTRFCVSKAVAEKEEDQPSGPTRSYMSEATEKEDHQPPGLTRFHVSEAMAEKEDHLSGPARSHVSEATEKKEDQPTGPTCSCVSEATAEKEEQPPELTRSDVSETTEKEDDQPPGPTRSYVLYIGNLNPKYSREVICSMLKDILGMASITLQRHNIEVIRKRRQAYAFVQLATEVSLDLVLKQLLAVSELEQDLLKELVKKGKNLVVGHGKTFAFGGNDSRETNSIGSSSESRLGGLQVPKRRKKPPFSEIQTNPGTKPAQHTWRLTERPAAFLSGTRSDSAIVQKEIVGKERLFYGAFMGNETRNVEFKRGGGEYLTGTLKHHVRKYVCAFLNSEGGSLLVGVEDNGLVLGVRCDHRDEDRVRLLIDSVLKGFKPQVFPAAYTLSFVPVIKDEDTGIFLKVIRLTVHPPKKHGEPLLYETDQGEVYIRRDGSIQGPLSGSAIQEWCRQKWTEENKKLEEKIETLLKEKEELRQQVQQNTSPRCCALM